MKHIEQVCHKRVKIYRHYTRKEHKERNATNISLEIMTVLFPI